MLGRKTAVGNKNNIIRNLAFATIITIILVPIYSFKNQSFRSETTALKVIINMTDSIKKISSYEFSLKAIERVEKGEYLSETLKNLTLDFKQ